MFQDNVPTATRLCRSLRVVTTSRIAADDGGGAVGVKHFYPGPPFVGLFYELPLVTGFEVTTEARVTTCLPPFQVAFNLRNKPITTDSVDGRRLNVVVFEHEKPPLEISDVGH